ncbi:putative bifunctional diguanylate cyclase/phosphodiesterase [Alkalimonas amylolytica]|uniref:EAL domain, c-di-GMP-specific phosphodiesterase class I (Or its enzymatically inactive variant) n=1 Tax=Alkalimonas amylolytica TaxID=152573 RepID=A0A1H3XZU2_ALKAM|nr:GGDEF domain-containing phosphodiesterase [Alkalimonas amylolytica]SEA04780.1 EAL domain, c-di-GMP-specific phosphodiesterase class I (or its enzymatically inactive variant) [Alkalimonas amylolytica]
MRVLTACLLVSPLPTIAETATIPAWLLWWPLALVVVILLLLWRIRVLQQQLRRQQPATAPEHSLLHDEISGYPNKELLRRQLKPLLQQSDGKRFALLLFKVTQFEQINEALGYQNSNLLLMQLAHRINEQLHQHEALLCLEWREQKAIRLCHLGGVDFVAWADVTAKPYLAEQVAKQVEQSVTEPLMLQSSAMSYHLVSGIACLPEHGSQLNELLDRAYLALQHHRWQAPDNAVFDPSLLSYTDGKLRLMAELRQGIEQNQLMLYVQPQIELKQRRLLAFEVLVRWQHPRLGLLAPEDFLETAEELGVIYSLTEWVLQHAIASLAALKADFPTMKLAVNLSSKDLLQDELVDYLHTLLHEHEVKPANLVLELTERALTDDPVQAITMLQRLKNLGVELALDDFGTGFSSLFYLRQLPISHVKIDCSFINDLHKSDTHVAIAGAIIDIARNLGLGVVAEGIEEELVEQKLLRMGCTRGQGFYYSRPFELAGIQPWLRQWQQSSGPAAQLSPE